MNQEVDTSKVVHTAGQCPGCGAPLKRVARRSWHRFLLGSKRLKCVECSRRFLQILWMRFPI